MKADIKSNFKRRNSRQSGRRRISEILETFGVIMLCFIRWLANLVFKYPYVFLIATVAVIALMFFKKTASTSSLAVEKTNAIGSTVNEVTSIRKIGQWDALDVTCEELVDTTESSFWGDRVLAKIYTGKMRIGVDFTNIPDTCLRVAGDTVFVAMPHATLLTPDFIDESRSRTFYQRGHWDAAVSNALMAKAQSAMIKRNLTSERLQAAEEIARRHLGAVFEAMGYKHVIFIPYDGAVGQK